MMIIRLMMHAAVSSVLFLVWTQGLVSWESGRQAELSTSTSDHHIHVGDRCDAGAVQGTADSADVLRFEVHF